MDIGKLSYYSRKIHRLSLWFVVTLGLVQMATGLAMKYPQWLAFFNQESIRLLHFQTASWFAIAFGAQLTTGMVMYFIPMIIKYKQKKRTTNPPSPQE
ncbi:hypothetical protein HZB58_05925 [Candidatus Gottesmanbacteria bacterium]|nr:hypothetical protein [Candidatus Gottesmanbacteria bacterium]